jgi:SAM-dependent methyltransferase
MDEVNSKNRNSYNPIARRWDEARSDFYGREQAYLDLFLEGIKAPAQLLDLGCGNGRPMAAYLLSKGHCVTGVDQSPAMLALARQRFPTARWIESTIEDYVSDARVDGILCWDALFHIDRTQHQRLLTGFAAMLRPGSRLMLTAGGSEHPAFTDSMFGHTFFYDSHPPATLLTLLDAAGFKPIIHEFMNPPTSGRDKGRVAVVAEKRAEHGPGP